MAEDIKKDVELSDEDLEKIAGGATNEDGDFVCEFCGKVFPLIKNASQAVAHYKVCSKSPYSKK